MARISVEVTSWYSLTAPVLDELLFLSTFNFGSAVMLNCSRPDPLVNYQDYSHY